MLFFHQLHSQVACKQRSACRASQFVKLFATTAALGANRIPHTHGSQLLLRYNSAVVPAMLQKRVATAIASSGTCNVCTGALPYPAPPPRQTRACALPSTQPVLLMGNKPTSTCRCCPTNPPAPFKALPHRQKPYPTTNLYKTSCQVRRSWQTGQDLAGLCQHTPSC